MLTVSSKNIMSLSVCVYFVIPDTSFFTDECSAILSYSLCFFKNNRSGGD
jgi:hypothetical protein